MKKPTTKTKKRVLPESVRVYFTEDNISLLREIKRIAKENHISESTLCNMMLQAGLTRVVAGFLHMKNQNENSITQQPAESIK